ncbi:sensor histidine kinase [Sphingosinicella sp. LHD-64]|uniref:sensor histidine kinase n=1 Tax=Sphingosinicella sp. LHD-64 TaxID=3072139 RepID=UPI00280C6018|nr:sensor histidine kinase [Sphingosinicella sp. LHD-64]MDQ8758204.1 sensor histidine kinase [Sphingosinicella sp. LHD-64]
MSDQRTGWWTRFWARLATGPKMLVILTLGLLPLGVVAILTSIHSARENSAERARQTLARLDDKAERLNELLARTAGTIRAANAAVVAAPPNSQICEVALRRLGTLQAIPGRYALYRTDGQPSCASAGFAPSAARVADPGSDLAIGADGQALRLVLYDDFGRIEGIAEFSRAALRDLTFIPGTSADFDLELLGGGRRMLLRNDYRAVPFVQALSDLAPIGDEGFQLRIRLGAAPVRAVDVLLILLPVLMWLAAALIGWIIVNRLLLQPLGRIQRVVSLYKPGDRPLDLPSLRSPAKEIGELGQAFDQVTRTMARHEADLEAAVERQKRLVREVHHRVKNNLQVVASLLNLHSRGSPNEEVAAAYASIQRRVDALAVVHRNHYAELEENRGVALKSLVSELAANLRASAPAQAAGMQIRLDIAPFHVTQDTAVSVAFLVTEIVEFGMLCGASAVSIVLEAAEDAGAARLTIEADSLVDGFDCDPALAERFDRIVIGLARQLRSALDRDPEHGRYAVRLAVIDRAEA